MRDALWIVESLCAITTEVIALLRWGSGATSTRRPAGPAGRGSPRARAPPARRARSASSADVAFVQEQHGRSTHERARDGDALLLPPRWSSRSPTVDSYPRGSRVMNSCAFAATAAATTSSDEGSSSSSSSNAPSGSKRDASERAEDAPRDVDAVSPDDARRDRPFSTPNTMFRRTERSNSAGPARRWRLGAEPPRVQRAMSFPSSKTRPLVGR